jgi:competence protein ComEC
MFDVFWFRFPLLRPLFALILGIVIQTNWCLNGSQVLILVFLNIGLLGLFKVIKPVFFTSIQDALFLNVNIILLGIGIIYFQQLRHSNFQSAIDQSSQAFIQIENSQITSTQSENYLVSVYTKIEGKANFSYAGKVLLKRNNNQKLMIGQCFQVYVSDIKPFSKSENEFEFDFASYYLSKGIDAQLNQHASIIEIKTKETQSIQFWINFFQNYLKEIILNHIENKDCSAVLLALIDGEDAFISKDLIKAYASLGTLHVLAVSGMHVNLLFGLLAFLFQAFKSPGLRFPILILQLIIIWFYALVCGFSPSIIRASLMITLSSFSRAMNRPQSQLNLLFNAAFLLLICQPNLLFDIGFQLSFMAVLGLLVLYESIFKLYNPKNKIFISIWTLCAASISAQIACLPLSIYYFHQLPLLFLPANLIAIPLCTIAIYWGLILVCIPILPQYCWVALSKLIAFNNLITVYLANLSYSKIDYLFLSKSACFLLALVIVLFYIYYKFKSYKVFQFALMLMIVIQIQVIKRNLDLNKQKKVQIFAYGNHPCIAISSGSSSLVFADSTVLIKQSYLNALKLNQNQLLNERPIQSNFYGLIVGGFFIEYQKLSNTWRIATMPKFNLKHMKKKSKTFMYENPKNTAFTLLLY